MKENEYVEIAVKKCRKDGFGMFKGRAPFTVEDGFKRLSSYADDA